MWISSRHSRTAEAKPPISRSHTFSTFGILLIFSIEGEHIARINTHAQPPYWLGTDTNTFWHVTQRKLFDHTAFLHDRTQNSRGGPTSHIFSPPKIFWELYGVLALSRCRQSLLMNDTVSHSVQLFCSIWILCAYKLYIMDAVCPWLSKPTNLTWHPAARQETHCRRP